MALQLRVVGATASRLGARAARAFGVHGGQIGRAPDNDWVLPDEERYVSGYHASVALSNGRWMLTDRSSNGTFVNGSLKPIPSHQPHPLNDGDTLRIGDYEIAVRITPETDFPPNDSLQGIDGSGSFATMTHGDIGAELNLPQLFAEPTAIPTLQDRSGAPEASTQPTHDAAGESLLSAADVARMLAAADPAAHASPPRPDGSRPLTSVPKAADAAVHASLAPAVSLLLRSAGLDAAQFAGSDPAQLLTVAGQLLREMTLGLGSALRTASSNESALAMHTAIRRISPLAVADSVNESLVRLLSQQGGRKTTAIDTVREGFNSLQKHDIARQQAMAEALASYVQLFSPTVLQQQFDRVLARSANGAAATPRHRYWDLYADLYRVLSQPSEGGMPHAFAEQFQAAYYVACQGEDATAATASHRKPAI